MTNQLLCFYFFVVCCSPHFRLVGLRASVQLCACQLILSQLSCTYADLLLLREGDLTNTAHVHTYIRVNNHKRNNSGDLFSLYNFFNKLINISFVDPQLHGFSYNLAISKRNFICYFSIKCIVQPKSVFNIWKIANKFRFSYFLSEKVLSFKFWIFESYVVNKFKPSILPIRVAF